MMEIIFTCCSSTPENPSTAGSMILREGALHSGGDGRKGPAPELPVLPCSSPNRASTALPRR